MCEGCEVEKGHGEGGREEIYIFCRNGVSPLFYFVVMRLLMFSSNIYFLIQFQPGPIKPGPAQSNPEQPNPTQLNLHCKTVIRGARNIRPCIRRTSRVRKARPRYPTRLCPRQRPSRRSPSTRLPAAPICLRKIL